MDPSGKDAVHSPARQDKLTVAQWAKVRQMPWEWDLMSRRRISHVANPDYSPQRTLRAQRFLFWRRL